MPFFMHYIVCFAYVFQTNSLECKRSTSIRKKKVHSLQSGVSTFQKYFGSFKLLSAQKLVNITVE